MVHACSNRVCAFLVIFCAVYYLESIGGTYIISVIQSIEKQFQIPSRWSGALVSAQDVGYVPTVVILSYLGSRGNRAKWIGGGCLLVSVANIIISSPHFVFPDTPQLANDTAVEAIFGESLSRDALSTHWQAAAASFGYCSPRINQLKEYMHDRECAVRRTNTIAYYMVFAGLVCLGVGHSMPWSLGLPLMDDNIKRKNLPTYFAFMFFIKIMGPLSGFLLGSLCNRLYFNLTKPVGLIPSDPRWIGAWWLGFLIITACLFLPSLALFCFPSNERDNNGDDMEVVAPATATVGRTPPKERRTQLNLVDRHKKVAVEKLDTAVAGRGPMRRAWIELTTFLTAVLLVVKTPIYTYSLIGRIFDAFAFKGFHVYIPKYLDNHYGLPQYIATALIALFGVFGFATGMVIGSVIMRRFKLEGRRAAGYVAACSFAAALLSMLQITLSCRSVVNTVGVQGVANNWQFNTSCNAACACDGIKLMPVCAIDGTPYFSPCHAGCADATLDADNVPQFSSCACVPLDINGTTERVVKKEWCKDDCKTVIIIYFAISVCAGLVGGAGIVCAVIIVLRAVPPQFRSISIGFSGFVVSIGTVTEKMAPLAPFAGTFLSPVFYGYVIDTTCIRWEPTCTPHEQGSCMIYDPDKLRIRIHVLYGALRTIGCIFDMFVLYHAKDLKLLSDENEEPVEHAGAVVEPTEKNEQDARFSDGVINKSSIAGIVAALETTEPYLMNITESTFEESEES